jgi:hypothetical protein
MRRRDGLNADLKVLALSVVDGEESCADAECSTRRVVLRASAAPREMLLLF